MSGRQFERGCGRGRGSGPVDEHGRRRRGSGGSADRGRGSQFQVPSFESRSSQGRRAGLGRGGRGGTKELEVFS